MQRNNSGRKRTRSDPDGTVLMNTRNHWNLQQIDPSTLQNASNNGASVLIKMQQDLNQQQLSAIQIKPSNGALKTMSILSARTRRLILFFLFIFVILGVSSQFKQLIR